MGEPSSRPHIGTAIPPPATAHGLDAHAYTTQRLKHASPEHLHVTTRRFFIGPIPEGWLNSNRKSWYKRRLELRNFSSREATFDATAQVPHKASTSLTAQPSLAARMAVSFPQPTDIDSDTGTYEEGGDGGSSEAQTEDDDNDEEDSDRETRVIAPVSTHEVTQPLHASGEETSVGSRNTVQDHGADSARKIMRRPEPSMMSARQESFKTAQEDLSKMSTKSNTEVRDDEESTTDLGVKPSNSVRTGASSRLQLEGLRDSLDDFDGSSKTALLPHGSPLLSPESRADEAETSNATNVGQRTMTHEDPAPLGTPQIPSKTGQKAPGVRFKVTEGVRDRKRRIGKRAGNARDKVAYKTSRRDTLREGTIIKMEKMLVRLDVTMQKPSDEFDENESVRTETRPIEKWREFMVVARKSGKQDDGDFRLQFYKTRVIPEIEDEGTKKKPAREVKLLPLTAKVNLYSSLDKTIVIWHPYRKGTRIVVMKPGSSAHAVEWYTFLRDALGQHRPTTLQIDVPDLDVVLHVERPFDISLSGESEDVDERTLLARAAAAEQAVAGKIISRSMQMLASDAEWSQVLQKWSRTANMGLAWKRYDRLEWVYGVNEQKMYGTMAMQHSYDLELRPKQHYPTEAYGRKGKLHDEPSPVEGFLIRLTSQKGLHKRMGKAFFKRLYFSTHDKYLVFSRPAKATPPHPPRLATVQGTGIPSSGEIIKQTPTMFEVDPFEVENDRIKWLELHRQEIVRRNDAEAQDEARRNLRNLSDSDGYINMCQIVKVRKLTWGAQEADEALESGSDVDYHVDVDNTSAEDGTTKEIDDERTFELVLANGLVVRLQSYSKETRDQWMKRLRKLIKYWKLRSMADINNLKSVRIANLTNLNIDEEMEARIGQFAHKWEVSRSEASAELYNMCRLTGCRAITISGMLYHKPRRHATFQRCSVILSGGQMLIYQATLRKSTGEQVAHIHQEKQDVISLQDCYCYSGLIVEEDLLYQNRTFDANQPGMLAATPRIYPSDGWTAADVDVMTCFVIWMNRRKGWFRSVVSSKEDGQEDKISQRSKLKRVAQLGVPGRGMVFKCRSRAERDLWVTSINAEIEAAVEQAHCQQGVGESELAGVRLQH